MVPGLTEGARERLADKGMMIGNVSNSIRFLIQVKDAFPQPA
jgi:hypothetical protein